MLICELVGFCVLFSVLPSDAKVFDVSNNANRHIPHTSNTNNFQANYGNRQFERHELLKFQTKEMKEVTENQHRRQQLLQEHQHHTSEEEEERWITEPHSPQSTLSDQRNSDAFSQPTWEAWLLTWQDEQSQCGRPSVPFILRQPRVAGGWNAEQGNWPWMVSFSPKLMNGQHWCGGILISVKWVLTSAHCLFSLPPTLWSESSWLVRLGKVVQNNSQIESTEQDFNISLIVVHPEFDASVLIPRETQGHPTDHDLVLVKLEGTAKITPWVQLICLPEVSFEPSPGERCVVTGWGVTSETNHSLSMILQQGIVPIMAYDECKSLEAYDKLLTPNMICAGYKDGGVDACKFDSGGPLQCQYANRWYAVGVTSWGDAGGNGCAKPMRPGVYTKVASHLPWILQTIYADYAHLPVNSWRENTNFLLL